MARLRIKEGFSPLEYELGASTVIGRSSSTDFRIPELTVSRRHAAVEQRAGAFVLTDLGSGNGTFVNEVQVDEPVVLENGDRVRLGDIVLEFEANGHETGVMSAGVALLLGEEESSTSAVIDRIEVAAALEILGDERRAADRLRLMYDISRSIGSTFDESSILETVIAKLFEVFPRADTAVAVLYDEEKDVLVPRASESRREDDEEIRISRSLVREVIETKSGLMTADAESDQRFQEFKTLQALDMRAVICVPMILGERVFGVLQVAGADTRVPFDREDMLVMLGIAGQAALALSNAALHKQLLQRELLHKDLSLAARIQESFLPLELPRCESYGFECHYEAALEVGGDYYGFLEPAEGLLGVAVGDVSGKGVSAALYMARLSSEIRYVSVGESRPSVVLRRLNEVLASEGYAGMFVTLILCSLDLRLRRMAVANAGHHAPLVCGPTGDVVELAVPPNVPLGVVPGMEFEEAMFELDPGDTVLLYTDGVNEAEDPAGEQFGDDRLKAAMLASDRSPAGVVETVVGRLREFVRDAVASDDVTVLAFGPEPRT